LNLLDLRFGFEDLEVWQRSVQFSVKIIETVDRIQTDRKHYRLLEQIESSSASVPMNLAEGKGRFSRKEFVHYCYIARGSLYESITLLEIFFRKREGFEIASMIKGLINAINIRK
jgi:four helix bundle protein